MNVWTSLFDMLSTITLIIGLLAVAFGVGLWIAQKKRDAANRSQRPRHEIPREWPLDARPLVNKSERRVWLWLRETFPDHLILPKLPITRFTLPLEHGEAQHWFSILNNVYCTFTICDNEGRVNGCVDVVGQRNLSQVNRQIKQSLLAQCGMAYWMAMPESLPERNVIRREFLGSVPEVNGFIHASQFHLPDPGSTDAPNTYESGFSASIPQPPVSAPTPLMMSVQETSSQLREALYDRRRSRQRTNDDSSGRPSQPASSFSDTDLSSPNSFLAPIDDEEVLQALQAGRN